MRLTLILLVSGCFVARTISRPSPAEDARNSEEEQAEYEDADEAADSDDSPQDEKSRLDKEPVLENDEEDPGQTQHLGQSNRNAAANSEDRPSRENFPGYKSNKDNEPADDQDDANDNSEYQPSSKQRENNRYIEKSDVHEQEGVQRLLRRDGNDSPRNENSAINHRSLISSKTASNEEGDSLFENNESNRDQQDHSDKREYNNEAHNANEQLSKKYYNTIQEGVPDEKRYRDNFNRDRRALQENCSDTISKASLSLANNEAVLENSASDDEEATIKKHVKKLSGEELEELLNSLSVDKRELLKKIMESDAGNINEINKREITKKAGAAPDENGYLESGQLEASKLQEGTSGNDSGTPSTETTEANKQPSPQPELSSLPVTKTLEATNSTSSVCLDNRADLIVPAKSDSIVPAASTGDSGSQAKVELNLNAPIKSDIKRETNSDDVSNIDNSFDDTKLLDSSDYNFKDQPNDSGYFCPQEEDLSQLMDEDSQLSAGNSNMLKREALYQKDSELSDSMKSLEESFPNAHAYDDDDPYAGLDMAPLVRVKRKNSDLAVKKRAAGILPDAKVAFFPYRAENDDEDNDEGNEFDDEGFYDRTANLDKSAIKDRPDEDPLNNFDDSARSFKSRNKNPQSNLINRSKLTQTNKLESDTMGLGTDTDSVLSGVEGIDDNLMFNSGSRNRRVARDDCKDENSLNNNDLNVNNSPMRSKPFDVDIKPGSDNYIVPNYHESEAFGPLPRSYEGELGRYKRIRRVKPSASQDINSSHN